MSLNSIRRDIEDGAMVPARQALADRAGEISEDAARWDGTGVFVPRPKSNDGFSHETEEQAFPAVDPMFKPVGSRVLIQFRQPIARTRGGLRMTDEVQQTDADNMSVAKVISVGGLAYHSRDTLDVWPEGAWCKVGDYVRVPMAAYQGDTFRRAFKRKDTDENGRTEIVADYARFATIRDLDVIGVYPDAETAIAERAFV